MYIDSDYSRHISFRMFRSSRLSWCCPCRPVAIESPGGADWVCGNCAKAAGDDWQSEEFDESVPGSCKFCPFCGTVAHKDKKMPPARPEPAPARTDEWDCSECSDVVPASWRFCPDCGPLHPQDWTCANCDADSPASFAFCPDCGTKQHAAYSDGRDKEPPPRPPPPPRTEPAADDWTCGKCKEFCSPSFFFCPSCGAAGA